MSVAAGGGRRSSRRIDGIVLLDKPPGASSNRALQRAKSILKAAKAGHAGTLDPMATGMLPLCFGQATKACGQLLGSSKAYRGLLRLGIATSTADAEGEVIDRSAVPPMNEASVRELLATFCGSSEQVPPMYSALKHQGRPLYELARRGEAVERAPRAIRIERLDLLELDGETLDFEVHCSKGTYVRVLAEDIAAALGTVGHLAGLRRLWVEPFQDQPMVELEEIERWQAAAGAGDPSPPWLLPVDRAFVGLPRIDLDAGQSADLRHGKVLQLPAGGESLERVAAYDPQGLFLGLVGVQDDRARVLRLFVPGVTEKSRKET